MAEQSLAKSVTSTPGMTTRSDHAIDSEHYRQMLVRDGDRRFREWHTAFLQYQQNFLAQLARARRR